MNDEFVQELLLKPENRRAYTEPGPAQGSPGFYAFFDHSGNAAIELGQKTSKCRLLYIGMTGGPLSDRDHPVIADSAKSTLRRSIGALLLARDPPTELIPIASGRNSFRFCRTSEDTISDWMRRNLSRATVSLGCMALQANDTIQKMEGRLITKLDPPLNIQHLRHATRKPLRDARAACRTYAHPPSSGVTV
jgi:hypothetical protein